MIAQKEMIDQIKLDAEGWTVELEFCHDCLILRDEMDGETLHSRKKQITPREHSAQEAKLLLNSCNHALDENIIKIAIHKAHSVGTRIMSNLPIDMQLKLISGRSHRMWTSLIAENSSNVIRCRTNITKIKIKNLSHQEIMWGVQHSGKIAPWWIQSLNGRSNVMYDIHTLVESLR